MNHRVEKLPRTVTLAAAMTTAPRGDLVDTRQLYLPVWVASALSSDSVRFHKSLKVCPTSEFSMGTSSLNHSVSRWYNDLITTDIYSIRNGLADLTDYFQVNNYCKFVYGRLDSSMKFLFTIYFLFGSIGLVYDRNYRKKEKKNEPGVGDAVQLGDGVAADDLRIFGGDDDPYRDVDAVVIAAGYRQTHTAALFFLSQLGVGHVRPI